MILKLICDMLFGVVDLIIRSFPTHNIATVSGGYDNAIYLLGLGLKFFPIDLWVVTLTNIVAWTIAFFTWSIIEWVYKKIPGVS